MVKGEISRLLSNPKNIKIVGLPSIVLLIAGISFLVYSSIFNRLDTTSSKKISGTQPQGSMSLPTFSATDYFGNIFKSTDFLGKFILVLFLDPRTTDHVDLVAGLSQQNQSEDFQLLVFLDDSDEIAAGRFFDKIRYSIHNINIITEDYSRFKERFGSPDCCDSFYLFDQGGQLLHTGLDWQFFASKQILQLFFGGRDFNIQEFACLGTRVKDIKWFNQLDTIINENQNYDFYIFTFFTEVCTNCLSGNILEELKRLNQTHGESHFISIILYDSFVKNDRDNLKASLKIKFQAELADPALLDKWKQQINKYGKPNLSNIIVLTDTDGKIVRTMSDAQYKDFFDYLVEKQ